MSDTCIPHHDWFNALLTGGLCVGLIVSYAPQHYRIISKGSSEGISPWFLLLGSTSAAANFLNIIALQWRIVRCCPAFTFGSCLEATAGIIQIGLQWCLFTAINVLYMMYYPEHLKYTSIALETDDGPPSSYLVAKAPKKSREWQLSIILSWVVGLHLLIVTVMTIYLLSVYPTSSSPSAPFPPELKSWTTFLGVSSALLAAVQYMPQLAHTYKMKVVGALSIPMMCIQSPGAILMVASIALRPGTDWTAWITFAVAGLMQATLLTMCIAWTFRQRRLGIDEFGNPLDERLPTHAAAGSQPHHMHPAIILPADEELDVPGLVTTEEEDPTMMRIALAGALQSTVEEEVRSAEVAFASDLDTRPAASEETPLIGRAQTADGKGFWGRLFG